MSVPVAGSIYREDLAHGPKLRRNVTLAFWLSKNSSEIQLTLPKIILEPVQQCIPDFLGICRPPMPADLRNSESRVDPVACCLTIATSSISVAVIADPVIGSSRSLSPEETRSEHFSNHVNSSLTRRCATCSSTYG
jgi:hypothetical protein